MKGKMSHLDKFLENRMLSAPKSVPSIQNIASEFISSNNLMERAAATCTDFILQQINYNETITVLWD